MDIILQNFELSILFGGIATIVIFIILKFLLRFIFSINEVLYALEEQIENQEKLVNIQSNIDESLRNILSLLENKSVMVKFSKNYVDVINSHLLKIQNIEENVLNMSDAIDELK